MKNTLLALTLLLPCLVTAQNDTQHQIDSLRKAIPMQHGLDKLNSYHVLGSYLFEAGSLEDMKTFFEEHEAALVQEWAKEKDPTLKDEYTLHRASLKLNLGSVLFNYGDFDGAAEQARNAMEYCRENEQWVQYYKHYLLLVEALTASLKYEECRQEAKNLYEDAKERNDAVGMVYSVFSMAEMNMLQYRLAEAEKYYRECIEIAAAVDFGNICYPLTNAHLFLFQSLTAQGKYDEALQAMPQTEAAVQRLEELEAQQNGYAGLGNRIILYTACTQYYLKMKDYRNAERYCTLAEELSRSIDATETTDYAILLSMRAQILEARGQYAQALKLAEQSCLLELAMGSIPTNLNDIMSVKARLLMRLGRVEESIALYDSIQTRTMDIFNTKYNAQLDEIRTIYEVDKLEHKNEIITIEKERHRINFLFALGGCILLLITLGIWIFYSRQIVLRNRELVRKNQQWANQQALEIIDKGKDTEIEKNMPAAEDYEIVEQAHRILLDGLFKEYELVLDTLAGKMGIHSKTLSQAINSVTGKNFNQFVNEYRIKEAIRIMSHEKDLRLKEIYWQTGFNSYSAFYRTFKQITGLHPTQFQNKDSETGGHILK